MSSQPGSENRGGEAKHGIQLERILAQDFSSNRGICLVSGARATAMLDELRLLLNFSGRYGKGWVLVSGNELLLRHDGATQPLVEAVEPTYERGGRRVTHKGHYVLKPSEGNTFSGILGLREYHGLKELMDEAVRAAHEHGMTWVYLGSLVTRNEVLATGAPFDGGSIPILTYDPKTFAVTGGPQY